MSPAGKIQSLNENITKLETRLGDLEQLVHKIDYDLDQQEQYSRRNCLLIHGLSTSEVASKTNYLGFENYIIELLNKYTKSEICKYDIDIAHPLPATRNSQKKSVIVNFIRRSVKDFIYYSKRSFKGSGLAITESLTKRRLHLMNEAKSSFGKQHVWSMNGQIFVNINNARYCIKHRNDINKLKL